MWLDQTKPFDLEGSKPDFYLVDQYDSWWLVFAKKTRLFQVEWQFSSLETDSNRFDRMQPFSSFYLPIFIVCLQYVEIATKCREFQPYLVRTWLDLGISQLKISTSSWLLTLPILRLFWPIWPTNHPSCGSLTYILAIGNKLLDHRPTLIGSVVNLNLNLTPTHSWTTLDDVKKMWIFKSLCEKY